VLAVAVKVVVSGRRGCVGPDCRDWRLGGIVLVVHAPTLPLDLIMLPVAVVDGMPEISVVDVGLKSLLVDLVIEWQKWLDWARRAE
jgi:hypothetical protein